MDMDEIEQLSEAEQEAILGEQKAQLARDRSNEWYRNNRQRAIDRVKGYREEIKKIAAEARNQPCMDCGLKYPACCMQFHHRDPSTKKGEVANRGSVGSALKELAKCDVICANCHCIRHDKETTDEVT
jgi:hypothetical protein